MTDLAPTGWQETLDTWLRIWRRACSELERNAYSTRAQLVERTAHGRLVSLMSQRGMGSIGEWM